MMVTIDRIEGTVAVAELPDGSMLDVPKALFESVTEGATYEIRLVKTNRREQARRLMDEVWADE